MGGIVGYVAVKNKQSPKEVVMGAKSQIENLANPENYKEAGKKIDTKIFLSKASDMLDSLVTGGSKDSPVVLGIKISNDSIGAVTDILQKLPSDQLQQIRSVVCASPSAN